MKILQLNMHRGKVADALLSQICVEEKVDLAIISEQYGKKSNGYWFEDDTATAAIWIPRTGYLTPKRSGSGNCFVWTQLDDVTIVSCYLTPSDSIEEFQRKLDEIEDNIRQAQGNFIIAGDFNARAAEWGMRTTNSRGRRIVEMASRLGLTVANTGNVPTFRRAGCEGTIPDITLVSDQIASRIKNWRVLETYTASDHQYISYSFEGRAIENGDVVNRKMSTRKWNVARLDRTALLAEIDGISWDEDQFQGDANAIAKMVIRTIEQACNKSMPKLRYGNTKRRPVFWWNEEIANARSDCLRHRRRFTRARRRGEAEGERTEYREAKKRLQVAILESKRKLWEDLREDINRNPWGTGYKLVMGKLCSRSSTSLMSSETMENIVMTLFPTNELPNYGTIAEELNNVPLFTMEELSLAAHKLRNNKSPGPDGIPAEVMKEIAVRRPEILLNMYNSCLRNGIFPEIWKKQQLVLISKGKGEPESPSAYRPLCLLDTAGKLLEGLLKPRLEEAVRAGGGLSERQHGFRSGRSTIGALKDVVDVVEVVRRQNHFTRPLILLATLDVKNAFNSLRWPDVLRTLEEDFCIPKYLLSIIRDYLRNRELIYWTTEGEKKLK